MGEMTRYLIWLIVASSTFALFAGFAITAGADGLVVFAWTPFVAAIVAWRWFVHRKTTKVPSTDELDKELRELLEGEKNR